MQTFIYFIKLKLISIHDLYRCHGYLSCFYVKKEEAYKGSGRLNLILTAKNHSRPSAKTLSLLNVQTLSENSYIFTLLYMYEYIWKLFYYISLPVGKLKHVELTAFVITNGGTLVRRSAGMCHSRKEAGSISRLFPLDFACITCICSCSLEVLTGNS